MNSTAQFSAILDKVQESLRLRKLADADYLLQSLQKDRSGLSSRDMLARYYLLRAHYLLLRGNYSQAMIKGKTALRLSAASSDLVFYSNAKNLVGAIMRAQGRLDESISAYTESLAFLKKVQDHKQYFKPIHNVALIHFGKGELGRASQLFGEAADYAKRFNTRSDVRSCLLNLARTYVLMGRFDDSLGILNELELTASNDNMLMIHANRIKSFVLALKLECGAGRLGNLDVLAAFKKSELSRDVAVCLEYLGLNEYFAGNYAKAREYYDQVLAMPEPTASAVAQTLRMLTDVEIAEGNWDAAKTTAAKAEVAINKISERIELGALWRAYGHIHTHDNDYAKAREKFEKSIDLLRQLGARYELALSHFDAGRSQAYSPDQQMEHLNQAKALFIDMEVPKRVAQVDAAISKISLPGVSDSQNGKRKLAIKSKAVQVPVIIAESAAMKKIVTLADRIKDNDMTVLITGETGTGKDLLAEYIHKSSLRAGKPYRAINSANLPETLLEAELFGYIKGAFSGASKDSEGLIASADGGTFVFDEIGEIPLPMQAKLLRVLDTKIVRQLGGSVDRKIDVRFVALTNRNLEQMVVGGVFRSDLYHRLRQIPIYLPSLRERSDDIIPLTNRFIADFGLSLNFDDLESELGRALLSYSWPGNVRELIAVAARVAALHDSNGNSDIARLLLCELGNQTPEANDRQRLFQTLQRHNGNKTKAAEELGIPRTTLISQLHKTNP